MDRAIKMLFDGARGFRPPVAGVRGWIVAWLLAAAGSAVLWGLVLTGSARALPSECVHSGRTHVTCRYTGSGTYSFTVPSHVRSLDVTAVGAAGGAGFDKAPGGAGASVKDPAVPVRADEGLEVVVGGVGGNGTATVGGAGGSPGGGGTGGEDKQGGQFPSAGGGGGGYSGLLTSDEPLVIGGGGGGGGGGNDAAAGGSAGIGDGGQHGANCHTYPDCGEGGAGGKYDTPGAGGLAPSDNTGNGRPGGFGFGGAGGIAVFTLDAGGGGGGGGHTGGGGGGSGSSPGGGGGGSSYGVDHGLTDETHATGPALVSITYADYRFKLAHALAIKTDRGAPETRLDSKARAIYKAVYSELTGLACSEITAYKDLIPKTKLPADIASQLTIESSKLARELHCP